MHENDPFGRRLLRFDDDPVQAEAVMARDPDLLLPQRLVHFPEAGSGPFKSVKNLLII